MRAHVWYEIVHALAGLLLDTQAVKLLELAILTEPCRVEDARQVVALVLVFGTSTA